MPDRSASSSAKLVRSEISLAPNVEVYLPTIPDLILTKRIGSRPKDLEDIRLLEILQEEEPE